MGNKSKPKVETVDTRTAEQKAMSGGLSSSIQSRMDMAPPALRDLTSMGSDWLKGVAGPMMDAFQTYAVPEITQGFRRGSLFSQSRGNAIQRALSDMMGGLTTEAANRNWQASLAMSEMEQRPYYESSAATKEALAFMGTPGLEAVGIQGESGPDFLGMGTALYGAGVAGAMGTATAAGGAGAVKAFFFCIPEGSLINVPNGVTPVEDLSAGDIVIDKDGNEVPLLMKYEFIELPTTDRFVKLGFNTGQEIVICDKHKIDGIQSQDLVVGEKGLISKDFIPYSGRSYDLLTSGRDEGYCINGIGVDSMISELQELTKGRK